MFSRDEGGVIRIIKTMSGKNKGKVYIKKMSVNQFFYFCMRRGISTTKAEEGEGQFSYTENSETIEDKKRPINRRRSLFGKISRDLSPTHVDILRGKLRGLSQTQVADKLNVTTRTIRNKVVELKKYIQAQRGS